MAKTAARAPWPGSDERANPIQHSASVWEETARPALGLPRLDRDIAADAVVVGGGMTGLSAARELAGQGLACVVLDAEDAGWGASGRNGGMAVLRYKDSWSAIIAAQGEEAARSLLALLHEAVDRIEANVEAFGIECDFRRAGHLTAATTPGAARELENDAVWVRRALPAPSAPRYVGSEEMRRLIGSPLYVGGYLDPQAAGIHPMNYCRGLAAGLVSQGVEIYAGSPATGLTTSGDRVRVDTPEGSVNAKKALVCTNGYTDRHRLGLDLHKRLIPMYVAVLGTEPLTGSAGDQVLPQNHLVTDTKRMLNYYRKAPNGGILFGGRGSFTRPDDPRFFDRLKVQLVETFPQLDGVGIAHSWTGRIAMTLDHFPHLGQVGERVFYALGFGGRGVALSHALGTHVARHAVGQASDLGVMGDATFRPVPLRGLHLPVMHLTALYYQTLDRLGSWRSSGHAP